MHAARKWTYRLVATLCLTSSIAVACVKLDGPQFSINIGGISKSTPAADIGKKLEDSLGNTFGRDVSVEGTVLYSVKLPFGLNAGLQSIPFSKPCGMNFKERAISIWPSLINGGGSNGITCEDGSIGGGAGYVVVGYRPVYATATTTTPDGSFSETVIVGYEPIYGMVNQDSPSYIC